MGKVADAIVLLFVVGSSAAVLGGLAYTVANYQLGKAANARP